MIPISHKDDVEIALRWFVRQPESAAFFAALDAIVSDVNSPVDTCALHRHDERRKFAANLIAMAEANKSDGQDSNSDEQERRNVPRSGQRKNRRHGPSGRG